MTAVIPLPRASLLATPRFTPLTLSVFQLLADGKHNQEIAEQLTISISAVQQHVWRIMNSTGTATRAGAVAFGIRRGVIK